MTNPTSAGVDAARDTAASVGRQYAAAWPNIWDDAKAVAASAGSTVEAAVAGLAGGGRTRAGIIHHVVNVAAFITVIVCWNVAAAITRDHPSPATRSDQDQTVFAVLTIAAVVLGAAWIVSVLIRWSFSVRRRDETKALRAELRTVAFTALHDELEQRRAQARQHQPGTATSRPRGPAPAAQEFGVSHEGAERLVQQWMQHLGELDAQITRFTGDGGIDVESEHYVAQVKNYTGTVGVAEIRELAGVVAVDGRRGLFFTSGVYASGSAAFAERAGIALFRYDAVAGTLTGEDDIARTAIQRGL